MDAVLAEPGRCQMLLLDVRFEQEGEDGLAVARLLREHGVDCSLVFISSYRDYVFDCFEARPLSYLKKPVEWDRFCDCLRREFEERYQSARLSLRIGGRRMSIPFSDVYALEATQHRVRIWRRSDFLDWNGALSTLESLLPTTYFCRCHRSFWINLQHVSELARTEARMDNNKAFPVSKRLYASVMKRHYAFLAL